MSCGSYEIWLCKFLAAKLISEHEAKKDSTEIAHGLSSNMTLAIIWITLVRRLNFHISSWNKIVQWPGRSKIGFNYRIIITREVYSSYLRGVLAARSRWCTGCS